MGHALRKVLGVLVRQQGWGLAQGLPVLARQAGVGELAGSSLKAALDLDWDDPATRDVALGRVLAAVDQVEAWVATRPGGDAPLSAPVEPCLPPRTDGMASAIDPAEDPW